jgi:peptide/nickel transport system substrate-binding protein
MMEKEEGSMSKPRLLALALAAVAMFVMAGCLGGDDDSGGESGGAAGKARPGGSIVVAVDGDAGTLDPTVDDTYAATLVDLQVFDTLLNVDDNGDYTPGLAVSWDQPDPLTWVLKLRTGVKFHDGTPFNAEAVKWNLDTMRDPEGGSSWSSEYASIESVTAQDPETVVIKLKRPDQAILAPMAEKPGMMRSPTAVEKLGKRFGSNPVGTGPFEFAEWVPNDHITLRKNENYWRKGRPYLDEATFRPITDPTAKINDLISGRVDTVDYVPPEQIERVQGNSGLTTEIGPPPYNAVVYLAMRTDEPPFDDPKVRRAVDMAIDRKAIVENVVFDAGEPSRSVLASTSWGRTDEVPEIPYDPDGAKQLLGGKTYTVEFLEPPSYPQVAQVIEQNLAAIGITAKLRRMDWGPLVDTYYKGDYQLMLSDLLGNQRPDPLTPLANFYTADGSLNGTAFSNPEIDRLLEQAAAEEDRDARADLFAQVQNVAQEQAPYAPIYHPKTVRSWKENFQGLQIRADGLLRLADVSQGG